MAARRCSTCSRNYPPNMQRCPGCGAQTWYASTAEPDEAPGEGEEYELKAPTDSPTYDLDEPYEAGLVAWRAECFEGYGFGMGDAIVLALRRDVDREQVARLVEAGATPEQVRAIVL